MLLTAKRRVMNEKKKGIHKKPVSPPPEAWTDYSKELVISFFWDWYNTDCDPRFTPDGKPWLDQDPAFWKLVNYVLDLFRWARYRAENPVLMIKARDVSLKDL
jgi:hypothetical protein